MKGFSARTLLEEKEFYEKMKEEEPEKEQFWKNKLARVEFEQWVLGKSKKEPPKYTLLV